MTVFDLDHTNLASTEFVEVQTMERERIEFGRLVERKHLMCSYATVRVRAAKCSVHQIAHICNFDQKSKAVVRVLDLSSQHNANKSND